MEGIKHTHSRIIIELEPKCKRFTTHTAHAQPTKRTSSASRDRQYIAIFYCARRRHSDGTIQVRSHNRTFGWSGVGLGAHSHQ
jgi:hypothetical protein